MVFNEQQKKEALIRGSYERALRKVGGNHEIRA